MDFWVTNISNMNVSLADLNLTIKAFTSVNLLDKKHYSYTEEQLQKSANNGSLAKKKDKIVVRKFAPEIVTKNNKTISDTSIPSRGRSVLIIAEEQYEELNVSDIQFAEENAELAELDNQPLLLPKERAHVTTKTTK